MSRRAKNRKIEQPSRARTFTWRVLWLLNWLVLLIFFAGAGILLGVYSSIAPLVPRLRDLAEVRIIEGTRILSEDGEELARVAEENREYLNFNQIPDNLKGAIVAVEDSDFYRHVGVDPRGIMRATWKNLLARRFKQGGSTITQQLARNAYDLRKRTIQRKLQEFVLALEIERRYTKDEILELYLNEIYFGEHAYGIKVAAKTYFDKEPLDLTLAECALIAGLPQAPTGYNPFRNPDRAKIRRNFVLDRMVDEGYITATQAQDAKAAPLKLAKQKPARGRRAFRAPYFVAFLLVELEEKLGADVISRGGLTIHTTLNWQAQKHAEKVVTEGVRNAKNLKVGEGALVALDARTGAIKAMVGGLDFTKSEFNRAVQGNRQVGSAFKPFVYTAAIDRGMKPNDIIDDSPVSFPDGKGGEYVPHNYDRKYMGEITLTTALALSRNVCAVKLMKEVGPRRVINTAYSMGMSGPLEPYLSLALGTCSSTPLEMARAFSVLANGGYRMEPYAFTKIEDASGNIILENHPAPVKVLSSATTGTVASMMSEVVARGTAAGAARRAGGLPFRAAGKTGTTSDHKDAWFVGWAEGLVCAVWVGNDQPIKMTRVTGGSVPAPIWMKFMKVAVPIISRNATVQIDNTTAIDRLAATIEQRAVEIAETDRSAKDDAATPEKADSPQETVPPAEVDNRTSDEILGVTPNAGGDSGSVVAICSVTGKRATPYCPRAELRTFPKGETPEAKCPLHPNPYDETE